MKPKGKSKRHDMPTRPTRFDKTKVGATPPVANAQRKTLRPSRTRFWVGSGPPNSVHNVPVLVLAV